MNLFADLHEGLRLGNEVGQVAQFYKNLIEVAAKTFGNGGGEGFHLAVAIAVQ